MENTKAKKVLIVVLTVIISLFVACVIYMSVTGNTIQELFTQKNAVNKSNQELETEEIIQNEDENDIVDADKNEGEKEIIPNIVEKNVTTRVYTYKYKQGDESNDYAIITLVLKEDNTSMYGVNNLKTYYLEYFNKQGNNIYIGEYIDNGTLIVLEQENKDAGDDVLKNNTITLTDEYAIIDGIKLLKDENIVVQTYSYASTKTNGKESLEFKNLSMINKSYVSIVTIKPDYKEFGISEANTKGLMLVFDKQAKEVYNLVFGNDITVGDKENIQYEFTNNSLIIDNVAIPKE